MKLRSIVLYALAGCCAGAVTGVFGAGGGMVLVPLLRLLAPEDPQNIFASSVAVIIPICIVSLGARWIVAGLPFHDALPYVLGSSFGGLFSVIFGSKIPVKWLHRLLGPLIILGGIRYLC